MTQTYRRPSILNRIPRSGHAVLEASAGTGKTYTIENLVLDLVIENKCPIEQILVVTFTEKATSELRGRIRALLEATLSGTPAGGADDDAQVRELRDSDLRALEDALFSFDRAPIFTIHAFCQRVLTDLAFESGSRFLLEVVDGRHALRRAFRAELRDHFATQKETSELLEKHLANGSSGREGAVDAMERLLWEGHAHHYLETPARAQNGDAIERFVREFDPKPLEKVYAGLHPSTRRNACAALARLSQELKRVGRAPQGVFASLDASVFEGIPDLEKTERQLGGKLPKAARAMHTVLERCAVALALDTRILDSFLPRVEERLGRDKRERGGIDYDDMLLSVWGALEGDRGPALAASLRSRFRFALLDEFQDTDYLQWKIFKRIFVEDDSPCRLFVVGDPKQAIYAFRGADVYAYLAARAELAEVHRVKPVPLIKNFRSTKALIDGLNFILDGSAKPPLLSGDTPYDHPVECGRTELRALGTNGKPLKPITMMRFESADDFRVPPARAAIGRHIAKTIRAMLDPRGRVTITDREREARQVEANNIFVLTRSRAESVEIGGYLREEGVPFAFYKQEGLFQTPEAYAIADILRAVEEPGSGSRQLKAWASPFFGITLRELFSKGEVSGDHPLLERIYQWHALAEEERFPELFDSILHESGLANRELFVANSERELTNYQHILEVLLICAISERLSLAEIIERLEGYIQETAAPPGMNGNLQRIESERRAVQVMSVHMSKGLEADVVFLFGGMRRVNDRAKVCVYHERGERRVIARSALSDLVKGRIKTEQEHEDERLMYVALTRARAKLYLPYFPDGRISGFYSALNMRLEIIFSSTASKTEREALFEIQGVQPARAGAASKNETLESKLKSWTPPENLLCDDRDDAERTFESLRKQHRAMVIRSYTSLARRTAQHTPEPEDFKQDVDGGSETADLAGGRSVGIFLHEVIEKLDFATLADPIGLSAWRERSEVKELFLSTMRRRGVADPKWFERGTEMIFNALRATIHLSDAVTVGPLFRFGDAPREMEFVYPIPQRAHPLLGSASGENWLAERGYLKGFMDFVFEQNGKTYFADWKSDHLDDYDPEAVRAHVTANYAMQAGIYSVGVIRLLQIRSEAEYDARFGGLLYVFLRAMRAGSSANGVYFHRPSWSEVVGYEKELMGVAAELGGGS